MLSLNLKKKKKNLFKQSTVHVLGLNVRISERIFPWPWWKPSGGVGPLSARLRICRSVICLPPALYSSREAGGLDEWYGHRRSQPQTRTEFPLFNQGLMTFWVRRPETETDSKRGGSSQWGEAGSSDWQEDGAPAERLNDLQARTAAVHLVCTWVQPQLHSFIIKMDNLFTTSVFNLQFSSIS